MMRLTPIVKNIIIINVLVFLIHPLISREMLQGTLNEQYDLIQFFGKWFALWKLDLIVPNNYASDYIPYVAFVNGEFQPIQIITHFFTHGGVVHIAFNMLMFASLGPIVEMVMGSKRFLEFYLFCGIVGGILVTLFDPSPIPVVGASGALFGVLVAFALYFPREKLSFFFIGAFEAKKFVIGVVVISAALVIADVVAAGSGLSVSGGISHFGHLAGAAAGYLYFKVRKYLPVK